MNKVRFLPALAGLLVVSTSARAQFADSAAGYVQGAGVTAGYNNSASALGAPTVFIGYQNADPFNPPYLSGNIVGVGTGGSLTLQFNTPIQNNPANPFGLDFIVFGHAGFNEDFSNGTTDGSLFTGGTSNVRVSVSADGTTFYTLNPAFAPMVDGLFPADSAGNPFVAVNPALTAGNFAGQDLAGIRALYAGSGGGAGFDLSWALDSGNQSVLLPSAAYVRFDVLSGTAAYLDAVSVVPEPASWTLALAGAGLLWLRRRIR